MEPASGTGADGSLPSSPHSRLAPGAVVFRRLFLALPHLLGALPENGQPAPGRTAPAGLQARTVVQAADLCQGPKEIPPLTVLELLLHLCHGPSDGNF